MSRQMAVKVTAGTAVAGALAFGLAIPAQAASSPAPAPKTSSTPAKRAVVTTAQLNAGTKLRLGDTGDAVTDVQNRLNPLGIIASGICFFLWNRGARLVSAGTLAVMNNLKIPLGVAVSLFVFREPANLWTLLVGGLLIGVALLPVRKS